jgi:hypothetical protein
MADVTTVAVSTTKSGATILTAAKAAVFTPTFALAALGGIIVFEWWKGAKDAKKFKVNEQAAS